MPGLPKSLALRDSKWPSKGRLRVQDHMTGTFRVSPSLSQQPGEDTEYSDPFDAQPQPPAPDDGYMEPYDARSSSSGECTRLRMRTQSHRG